MLHIIHSIIINKSGKNINQVQTLTASIRKFMTELLELADLALINSQTDETLCPFCQKEPIGHKKGDKKSLSDKVKSIPKELGCDVSSWKDKNSPKKRTEGDLPYTMARHHLISAIQCYAKIKRLVRMGDLANYNINHPKNGIGLPTTVWDMKYVERGEKKQYGKLDEPTGKRRVANALMTELGAQWHVGHHSFKITVPKVDADTWSNSGIDEKDEDDYPHDTKYDILVIKELFSLVKSFNENSCDEEDRSQVFIENMNKISGLIKGKLEKFNSKKPADSSPFFVSLRAYEYSKIADNLPAADLPQNNSSRGIE